MFKLKIYNYVKQQRKLGYSNKQITNALFNSGYTKQEAEFYLGLTKPIDWKNSFSPSMTKLFIPMLMILFLLGLFIVSSMYVLPYAQASCALTKNALSLSSVKQKSAQAFYDTPTQLTLKERENVERRVFKTKIIPSAKQLEEKLHLARKLILGYELFSSNYLPDIPMACALTTGAKHCIKFSDPDPICNKNTFNRIPTPIPQMWFFIIGLLYVLATYIMICLITIWLNKLEPMTTKTKFYLMVLLFIVSILIANLNGYFESFFVAPFIAITGILGMLKENWRKYIVLGISVLLCLGILIIVFSKPPLDGGVAWIKNQNTIPERTLLACDQSRIEDIPLRIDPRKTNPKIYLNTVPRPLRNKTNQTVCTTCEKQCIRDSKEYIQWNIIPGNPSYCVCSKFN